MSPEVWLEKRGLIWDEPARIKWTSGLTKEQATAFTSFLKENHYEYDDPVQTDKSAAYGWRVCWYPH